MFQIEMRERAVDTDPALAKGLRPAAAVALRPEGPLYYGPVLLRTQVG